MECYKRLRSLAKLQRHSLTKMFLTPFSTYSARKYIIIDRKFNFDNPDEISALINVMFCIPRVLIMIRMYSCMYVYVLLYKMEDINKL